MANRRFLTLAQADPPPKIDGAPSPDAAPKRQPTCWKRPTTTNRNYIAADEAATTPTGEARPRPRGPQHCPIARNEPLQPVRDFLSQVLAILAVVTCTFGNLAAYGQTNIKRMLAYSTIAHAGYMMMPVAAAVAMSGSEPPAAERDRRVDVLLCRRLSVHEPGGVRHHRVPAQHDCIAKKSPTMPA